MMNLTRMQIRLIGCSLFAAAVYASGAEAFPQCVYFSDYWAQEMTKVCSEGSESLTVWAKGWPATANGPQWISLSLKARTAHSGFAPISTVSGIDAAGNSVSNCLAIDNTVDGTTASDLTDCETAVRYRLWVEGDY
jgi:hypothetical protein